MSYSKDICSRIIKFLDHDDWKYRLDEDKEIIKSGLSLKNKMKKVDIVFDLRDDKFFIYMTYPMCAGEDERPEVLRLINRINYGIMFGNFEMDERDGEIRFRYAVDCDNCLPSQEVIRHGIYRSAATVEKYGDALIMVIMGFSKALDAYKAAQKDD